MGPPEENQIRDPELNELAETGIFDQSGIGTCSRRTLVIQHTQGSDSNFPLNSSELYIELGNYIDLRDHAIQYPLQTSSINDSSFSNVFSEYLPQEENIVFDEFSNLNVFMYLCKCIYF